MSKCMKNYYYLFIQLIDTCMHIPLQHDTATMINSKMTKNTIYNDV